MQATVEELMQLLEVQKTDFALLKIQKEMKDLPQRAKATALKEKKTALQAKFAQLKDVQADLELELNKLENEDLRLADKEKHAQELIETAGSDYRSIESHTKELDGFAKRRANVHEKVSKVVTDLDKVEKLLAQLDAGMKQVDTELASVVLSYKEQSAQMSGQISKLDALRADQMARVNDELQTCYDDTARKCAGVAIGRLEAGKCSVCRAPIEGGRLLELRAHAPLGTCPTCGRMLLVE